jgi:predicted AAA+ superfamily ATPase
MDEILNSLKTINFWQQEPSYNIGFVRESYLDKLKKTLGNKLIKVIVGQRRSGKSYIVRQLIKYLIEEKSILGKNIFYLNKELYEFEKIKAAADLDQIIRLYKKKIKPSGKVYIFIDEVQDIEDWEKIIVSLAQHTVDNYEVFITGSNSRLLSGELASNLSGRYLAFEVFPFSYFEFLDFFNYNNNKKNFIAYLEKSGLPEIYNIEQAEIQSNYFRSLKNTILLKDIMYRHKIRDYVLLEDLFLFLLHNVGNLVSVSSIIKYYKNKKRKADFTTITTYISYMEDAFIIRQCRKYSLKTKEFLSGDKKYYVNDLGFRNYLFPQLKTDISAMLENFVYLHLLMAGFEVKVGYVNNLEIDFVAVRENLQIYIQVTYLLTSEETKNREFRVLEAINDNYPKYLISMDDITINHPKGIIHQNIWDFIEILKTNRKL